MCDPNAMGHDDSCVESLTSWFDYLSLESFLGFGWFGYVFKGVIFEFLIFTHIEPSKILGAELIVNL